MEWQREAVEQARTWASAGLPRFDVEDDLFGTLYVASEYVQDAGSREPVIIILSDMLQSARDVEMEELRQMPTSGVGMV